MDMAILKRAIFSLWLLAGVFSSVKADENAFWRYFGGKPVFRGGEGCSLRAGEAHQFARRRGYDVEYLPRLKSCLWVAYTLTPSDVSNQVGRVGSFRKDMDALKVCVPDPADYIGSGYDRGHMAPSQDMQYNEGVSRESFFMGNMMPQTPHLNRGEWKRFETKTHNRVMPKDGVIPVQRVYVLVGPIFSKDGIKKFEEEQRVYEEEKQGRPPILKPDAFWKIVKYGVRVEAVIMNQHGVAQSVSVQEISQKTGIEFFGGLSSGLRDHYLSTVRFVYHSKDNENKEKEKQ